MPWNVASLTLNLYKDRKCLPTRMAVLSLDNGLSSMQLDTSSTQKGNCQKKGGRGHYLENRGSPVSITKHVADRRDQTQSWHIMLERLGTLLLVASFGFAMAQTAIAQDNDSHTVTINVKDIAFLDVNDSVNLTFDSFDESDGTFASASASTTYEVRTNRSNVSLEVNVTNGSSEFQSTVEHLGLTVSADNGNGGQGSYEITTISGDGGDEFNSGKVVDGSLGPLSNGSLSLSYEGEITEEFTKNADEGNNITVKYTITGGPTSED